MEDLTELADHINATLIYGAMGMNDEEIISTLNEEGIDDKTTNFVIKTVEIILEEVEKHFDEISKIIVSEDEEDDPTESVTAYLKDQKVSEHLTDFIYTYIIFIISKANAEIIIEKGLNEGKSEEEIKLEIQECGLDKETTETIYTVAMANMSPQEKPVINYQKLAGKYGLRGLIWLIIAAAAYFNDTGNTLPFIAFGVGLIFIGLGTFYLQKTK